MTIQSIPFTVPNGTAASDVISTLGGIPVGIHFDTTMTNTTVQFSAGQAAGTLQSVVDGAGAAYSKTIASNKYLPLDPTIFAGCSYMQLTFSGGNEGGLRNCRLAVRV